MSLTGFLKANADVRAEFRTHFEKPWFWLKADIKAPPLTESWSLTGTAFDYLLRFYVQKLNPRTKTQSWVAEEAIARLEREKEIQGEANRLLSDAKLLHARFLESRDKRPRKKLIEAAVRLAYFDTIYRVGILDENVFNPIPTAIVDDLQAMLHLVTPEYFVSRRRCILNPTFGKASSLVNGADADLIIDETLIDIKTTKNLKFEREMFNQLVGYYVLSRIGGIDHSRFRTIKYLAVYYSRYGILHRIPVSSFVDETRLTPFLRWFKARARRAYSNRITEAHDLGI